MPSWACTYASIINNTILISHNLRTKDDYASENWQYWKLIYFLENNKNLWEISNNEKYIDFQLIIIFHMCMIFLLILFVVKLWIYFIAEKQEQKKTHKKLATLNVYPGSRSQKIKIIMKHKTITQQAAAASTLVFFFCFYLVSKLFNVCCVLLCYATVVFMIAATTK